MAAMNGPSPSNAAAAVAECHYRSGRYGVALGELERSGGRRGGSPLFVAAPRKDDQRCSDGADGVIMTDPAIAAGGGEQGSAGRRTASRVEFLALPPLAAAADAAMCRLRAAAAGRTRDGGEEDASDLLEGALRSNGAYREALRGAAWSLLDRLASCRASCDGGDEDGTVAAAISSIRRAVGETSLAVLMAAVSASHLLLRGGRGDEAWEALSGSASFAARALTEAADDGEEEGPIDGVEGSLAALARLLPAPRGRSALRSLQTAFKASALASRRMILVPPPAASSSDGEGPPAKRQRTRTPNEGEGSKGGSVWSPAGIDGEAASDPPASAREHLADGLAYHVASRRLPNTRTALLRERRDACLDAAAEWEERSRLFDCFGSPSSLRLSQRERGGKAPDGPRRGGGRAWRVGCCLRLSDRPLGDGTDPTSVPAVLLASSSFARKLAASDLARRGDHAGALGLLRRCLEDEGGMGSDDGADGEDSDAHTAGCAARCLLAEGRPGAALELTLHLHWRREDRARNGGSKGGRADGGPCALLVPVGEGATAISTGRHSREKADGGGDRVRWDVFAAASLAGEWPTCLSALDGMASGPRRAEAARAFAMLQCRRPSDAESAAAGLLCRKSEGGPREGSLGGAAGLYRADALLQRGGPSDAAAAAECTARALGCLEVRTVDDNDDETSPSPSAELLAAAHCDHGVALLARGDGAGALLSFRRSVSLAPRLDARPAFNLALLLLREGRLDGAADAWLAVRGLREDWRAALAVGAGRDAALARLRGAREVAANRHGLLLAGRRMAAAAAAASIGELAADRPPTEPGDVGFVVDGWSPPSDGHEDDDDGSAGFAAQATALDVLLLRHAVQVVERRRSAASSSLFRRPG